MIKPGHRTPSARVILVALALLIVASMVMMVRSNYRWDLTLREGLIVLDRLSESRRAATAAELHVERLLSGDASSTQDLVMANLARAQEASRSLLEGSGQLAGFTMHGAPTLSSRDAAAAYAAELEKLGDAIRSRMSKPATTTGLELRLHYRAVEEAAAALESVLLGAVATQRKVLHRLDALNIALIGLLTLFLYYILARTERLRACALEELVASESRLRAFVSGMPGVSFLLDAEGRYLGVFGNDKDLLLEPADAIMRRRITDVLPADAAEGCLRIISETLSSRRTTAYAYQLTIDGRERCFDARIAPVGDTESVIWLAWDVTEQRHADQRVRELSRLYGFLSHVARASMHTTARDALLERVCDAALRLGGFRRAWFDACGDIDAGGVGTSTRAANSVINADLIDAWSRGEVVCVTGLRDGAKPPVWAAGGAAEGMTAVASVPLRCGSRLIGVLHLASDSLDLDRAEEVELLKVIGEDISFALTRFELDAQHANQTGRIKLLAAALESSRDGIMITDLEGRIVSVNRAFTELSGYAEAEVVGQTPRLLRSGMHSTDFYQAMWDALKGEGCWQGEIWNQSRNGTMRPQFLSISTVPGTSGTAEYFVSVLTDLTSLKQAEDRLDSLTHFDPLTELPNRLLIRARLEHSLTIARQTGDGVAVLFIDLDHFQAVNDGLGHSIGDELLVGVAQRLQAHLRRQDILGRQSGDEFVFILHGIDGVEGAGEIAQQLIRAFAKPFYLPSAGEIFAQISIGVAVHPGNDSGASELLRNAESAVHQAKRSGRGTWCAYAPDFTSAASSRISLESRMRRALRDELFELHYQPLVNLANGAIIGAEALVRLRPDGGRPLGPAEFIPLLEDTGLIRPFGEWVQRQACRQGRQWLDEGRDFGILAVNLSAAEIRGGRVEAQLRRVLAETGLPPERLELEVTESGLMSRGSQVAEFLGSLKALGVQLAIDDFGTGYSSLSYLRSFPVDKLKIDRSFIRYIPHETGDMQLVATIVAMAKGLGLRVLAEGVETEAQRLFLERLGCDFWQGYLCSPPLSAADFATTFLRPAVVANQP